MKENIILLAQNTVDFYKRIIPEPVQVGIQNSLSMMGRFFSKGWDLGASVLTALGGPFKGITNRVNTAVASPREMLKGYSETLSAVPSAVWVSATSTANYVKENLTSNVTYLQHYIKRSQTQKVSTNTDIPDERLTKDTKIQNK